MIDTLRWRTESGGVEWLTALTAPVQNGGFTECGRYLFQIPGPVSSMFIDDEPLRVVDGCWVWEPGFYAGEVTAVLQESPEARPSLFLFDVAPNPEKAGREEFRLMLDDLRCEAPESPGWLGARHNPHGTGWVLRESLGRVCQAASGTDLSSSRR